MDTLSTTVGISFFNRRQPKSLADWNARYEALSLENDWWFKAVVALAGWVRTALAAVRAVGTPAPQVAHA
jgi:hypothetical protein